MTPGLVRPGSITWLGRFVELRSRQREGAEGAKTPKNRTGSLGREHSLALSRNGRTEVGGAGPQAAGFTWYPNSFLAPLTSNQPYLDRALAQLQSLVEELAERGVSSERVVLLGFSQGACLVSEFAARNPRRYGGVVGLIGGLIGPPATPRDYTGALEGTPVFLGCSDPDPHVPLPLRS